MPGSTRWPATAIFSITTPAMGEWMVSVRRACPLSSSSRICCGERSQRRSRSAGARERSRGHPRLGERALPEPPLRLARQEILALRGQELRAVEGEERVALADRLPGVVRLQLLDEAAHLERYLREPPLVEVEPADGADHLLDRAALGRAPGEADRLLLGGVEADRGARELGRLVDGEGGARQRGEDPERRPAGHGRSSRGSSPPTAVSRPA